MVINKCIALKIQNRIEVLSPPNPPGKCNNDYNFFLM